MQSQILQTIASQDRRILTKIDTMQSHVDASIAREILLAKLSTSLGGLSVVLVGIGIYGVFAWLWLGELRKSAFGLHWAPGRAQ